MMDETVDGRNSRRLLPTGFLCGTCPMRSILTPGERAPTALAHIRRPVTDSPRP